jgi:hypothetical protein
MARVSIRSNILAIGFGLAVGVNAILWTESLSPNNRAWLGIITFVASAGLLRAALRRLTGDRMSERRVGALGAED